MKVTPVMAGKVLAMAARNDLPCDPRYVEKLTIEPPKRK
jgi:hypothetical protein